jgi:molybdate-binding protein/DNA-binding XRE family transcriptional regulator
MPATAAEGREMRPEDAGASGNDGQLLRLARQVRGFSRRQLAQMAGISAQQVASIESGRSGTSLQVALALARALAVSVEEVFGSVAPVAPVSARPVAPAGQGGSRVVLAPVGDTFVALPPAGAAGIGFGPVGGITIAETEPPGCQPHSPDPAGSWLVQPMGSRRPTVVAAGDDPALPLLQVPLSLLDPPLDFTWWPCGGGQALALACRGLVHAAAVCLCGDLAGRGADLRRHGAEVIGFCSWREGLALQPELAAGIAAVADLHRAGLRIVNREPGAQARRLLDDQLVGHGIDPGQLPGYQTQATGHLQVAAAIAARLADAGIASEPAALAYDLAFVPLASERVDLIISPAAAGSPQVRGLRKALSSRWLADQLASLPGYDPLHCGQRVTAIRLQGWS